MKDNFFADGAVNLLYSLVNSHGADELDKVLGWCGDTTKQSILLEARKIIDYGKWEEVESNES